MGNKQKLGASRPVVKKFLQVCQKHLKSGYKLQSDKENTLFSNVKSLLITLKDSKGVVADTRIVFYGVYGEHIRILLKNFASKPEVQKAFSDLTQALNELNVVLHADWAKDTNQKETKFTYIQKALDI